MLNIEEKSCSKQVDFFSIFHVFFLNFSETVFLIRYNLGVFSSIHQHPTSLRKICPTTSHSMLEIEEQSCSKQVDFSQFLCLFSIALNKYF